VVELGSHRARVVVGLLVAATILRAIVWIVVLPPWQGPDEFDHYSYVERIVESHSILPLDRGEPNGLSAALVTSAGANGYISYRDHALIRPIRRDIGGFPAEPHGLPATGSGTLDLNDTPPAYYLLGAVAYAMPFLHDATAHLYAIRLVSALLGGLTILLVFRLMLAAEVPELLALLGTAALSLLPMFTQASAIVNPDILLAAGFAGLAASCLRARGDPTRRRLAWVLGWGVLTALAKPIGGPSAIVIAIGLLGLSPLGSSWRRRAITAGGLVATLLGAAVYGLPAGIGVVFAARYGASYLWQFYLPRLPGQVPGIYSSLGGKRASWWIWVEGGVGKFGLLTVPLPTWAYRLAVWSLVAGSAAAVWGFVRQRANVPRVAGALVVASLAYVLLLHVSEIVLVVGHGPLLLQGRYLIPVVPLFATALYLGLARIGRAGVLVASGLLVSSFIVSLEALNQVLFYFG
jgi:hypothetical protein